MKAFVARFLTVGAIAACTGCTSSSQRSAPLRHHSAFSTAQRLWEGDSDIKRRAESLERKGLSADEARQYAEIEYLKSRAGSPLR
jgi:hypothetical protein